MKTNWAKETVLVIGTGISGLGALSLLHAAGAAVILYDQNASLTEEAVREKIREEDRDYPTIVIGALPEELAATVTRVVPSPAVPLDTPFMEGFRSRGIRIDSEIELAFQFEKGTFLAITGTNGKTTTTSLVGAIMAAHAEKRGTKSFIVGNIGESYALAVPQTTEDTFTVGEISSFQLEAVTDFHPRYAAITNITPDHLDRHKTMEAYIAAKKRITANQTAEDVCVLNYEDPVLRAFGERECPSRVLFFSSARELEEGYFLRGDAICRRLDGKEEELLLRSELRLVGLCNAENVMCAIALCAAAGVPMEIILETAKAFAPVEHRIEYVATVNDVEYYNDSKATNPDAAIQGIRAMSRPTLLIAGGYDKHSEYDDWIEAFDGKVKDLVLIGQTADAIEACARAHGISVIHRFDGFAECVRYCMESAVPGDAVLLSPACASWGMFPNYEVRGREFKSLVREKA